jgi:hypothetical protein
MAQFPMRRLLTIDGLLVSLRQLWARAKPHAVASPVDESGSLTTSEQAASDADGDEARQRAADDGFGGTIGPTHRSPAQQTAAGRPVSLSSTPHSS